MVIGNEQVVENVSNLQPGEQLEIIYVRVRDLKCWDRNPKIHDISGIRDSIIEHGFKDPPKWEAVLNGLVEGNGRFQALSSMENEGLQLPRGIMTEKETGFWCAPILIGVDALTRQEAERYAIRHNNLVLGDPGIDESFLWDDTYVDLLADIQKEIEQLLEDGEEEITELLKSTLPETAMGSSDNRQIPGVAPKFKGGFDPTKLPDYSPEMNDIGKKENAFVILISMKSFEDCNRAMIALSLGKRKPHQTEKGNNRFFVLATDDDMFEGKLVQFWVDNLPGPEDEELQDDKEE